MRGIKMQIHQAGVNFLTDQQLYEIQLCTTFSH